MKTVLLFLVFELLISLSVAGVANRKGRSLFEPPDNDVVNTVTPSTSTGGSDQGDLQKLYEFFRIMAEAMEAQATGNIKSKLDKYPVWDVIGQILNGTLEIETTATSTALTTTEAIIS